jgi:hypothetical protein
MTIRKAMLAVLLSLLATPAFARSAVPLVEFPDQGIAAPAGKTLTDAEVREAIVRAAKSLGWTLDPAGDQKLVATLVVRNKHTIAVNIAYTPEKVSVTFNSSINMKYEVKGGVAVIHPNYNEWTRKLVDAIRFEAGKG